MTVFVLPKASQGPYAWEYNLPKHVKRMKVRGGDGHMDLGNPQSLPLEGSTAVSDEVGCHVLSKGLDFQRSYLQHEDLAKLPRSEDVFTKIHLDPCIQLSLPKPGATAGVVLRHSVRQFELLLQQNKPMSFKFGITSDPSVRWHNSVYGYKFGKDIFEHMLVVYAASNPHGPAFLEAALIDRFGSFEVAS